MVVLNRSSLSMETTAELSLETLLVISEKSFASRAILPCSRISPATVVSIPSSMSLPVSLISLPLASMRIHSNIDMVVFEGTSFSTILIPLTSASF